MSNEEDQEKQVFDIMEGIVERRSPFLAGVFNKYRGRMKYEDLGSKTLQGTVNKEGITFNLGRENSGEYWEFCEDILTAFHEIGHLLDKKSEYHFGAEWRAYKFEAKVAEKLGGIFPKLLGPLARAARDNDADEFHRVFTESSYGGNIGREINNLEKVAA
ncbi:hypothetical protein CMI48_00605 [Candidatus Pacearchaeota archaeon]|nr:hypothetical protein [Candidatus Pacearchaeota archaeon]|tara:strand:- start:305 stop:784 length:480 start_codon:yes stop_codon:yes gene_type:complete